MAAPAPMSIPSPPPARPAKLDGYRDAEVAATYDRRWDGAQGARRHRRDEAAIAKALDALAAAAGRPLETVLDVPCGTGRFTEWLRDRGLRPIGGELSLAMLDQAKSKAPGAPWIACDLAQLPFDTGSCDVALCVRFMHLVRDQSLRAAYLSELARVARHGVVVDFRHSRTLRVWGRRVRHRLGWLEKSPANLRPSAIREALERAGLREVAWIPVHRAPLLSDKVIVAATRA